MVLPWHENIPFCTGEVKLVYKYARLRYPETRRLIDPTRGKLANHLVHTTKASLPLRRLYTYSLVLSVSHTTYFVFFKRV